MANADIIKDLLNQAEGYAEHAMRTAGSVRPTFLIRTPSGMIYYTPRALDGAEQKDSFANVGRLICAAYEANAVVVVLEAWMKLAKDGEPPDPTEPPSEAFDRQEVVLLTAETQAGNGQRILPIIRTDAGGFFGFGEFQGPNMDGYQGRFAQILPPQKPSKADRDIARALLEAMGVKIS